MEKTDLIIGLLILHFVGKKYRYHHKNDYYYDGTRSGSNGTPDRRSGVDAQRLDAQRIRESSVHAKKAASPSVLFLRHCHEHSRLPIMINSGRLMLLSLR
jgi:hypothetical protein